MHLLIPYACPPVLETNNLSKHAAVLRLPHLQALLQRLTPSPRQLAEAESWCPLWEALHAQALGLPVVDGLLPWAALDARAHGISLPPADAATHGFAWLSLCQWAIEADHVRMGELAALQITQAESESLLQAMRPYFAEDGITLYALRDAARAGTWLASGAVLRGLPCASLARVQGARVDAWLPRQAEAAVLRRLQNEMQMLLYTHPINEARQAQGLPSINAFWISGTGDLPPQSSIDPSAVTVLDNLRVPAQQQDWQAWLAAWQTLDSGALADCLHYAETHSPDQPITLTLCGDHAAQSFSSQSQAWWQGWWQRSYGRWQRPRLEQVLAAL